jgi:hypothetical protein
MAVSGVTQVSGWELVYGRRGHLRLVAILMIVCGLSLARGDWRETLG